MTVTAHYTRIELEQDHYGPHLSCFWKGTPQTSFVKSILFIHVLSSLISHHVPLEGRSSASTQEKKTVHKSSGNIKRNSHHVTWTHILAILFFWQSHIVTIRLRLRMFFTITVSNDTAPMEFVQ